MQVPLYSSFSTLGEQLPVLFNTYRYQMQYVSFARFISLSAYHSVFPNEENSAPIVLASYHNFEPLPDELLTPELSGW
jgi:hypothetical protein